MTADDGPGSTFRRRQFLAGLGAVSGVAVAGCSDLPLLSDDASVSFTAADADTVLADADATPTVEWPAPVRPAPSALDATLERIDDLLADVPETLGPEDVPNGVVRESIAEQRDDAASVRTEATDATGDGLYRGIRDARGGRESARASLTTLLAIDEEREALVEEFADEREAVRSPVRDRLEAIDYRGDDTERGRLRAALYYQQRESDLTRADGILERWTADPEQNVVDLGDAAGDLEFATATLECWDHLEARYEADLDDGDGATDLESVFDDALAQSIDRAEAVDVPDQERDDWAEAVGIDALDHGGLEQTAWRFGRSVTDAREGIEAALDGGRLGTGLERAIGFEQAYRGFERFRGRIDDGTIAAPETADTIRTERERALEAAATAREEIPVSEPTLGAYVLGETLQSLAWVDETVRRAADNDPEVVVSLTSEYGEYARYRAELEVLPAAVDAVRARVVD